MEKLLESFPILYLFKFNVTTSYSTSLYIFSIMQFFSLKSLILKDDFLNRITNDILRDEIVQEIF